MQSYRITNQVSGLELGIYEGEDEMAALDAMARDAGYHDYAHACEVVGADKDDGELLVEMVDAEDAEDAAEE